MRLALIAPGYAAELDWGIPVLRDLVRGLGERHDVTLFALRYPHRVGCESVDGITVHTVGAAAARGPASARLLVRAVARVVSELRPRPPDLLHALWADEPGVVAVTAARVLRVPAIASVLGGEAVAMPDIGYGGRLGLLNRRLLDHTLRRAARVTVPSEHVRRCIERTVGPDRLVTLPLGIDPDRFHAAAPAGEESRVAVGWPRLLHVGSLVPVKDQATLLAAFARVVSQLPDAHLHIAGDGPLRARLEQRANQLGLAGRVTFHGRLPHDHLAACYRAADLYVQSSRHESQGMAVLEAAACGLPVVGTAVGMLPELPDTISVPVRDAAALAAAMISRFEPATTPGAARTSAAAEVLERYTMPHTLDHLDRVYRSILAGRVATGRT